MNTVSITRDVHLEILNTIGVFPSEAGGIIASREDGAVCKYYFDVGAGTGKTFYRPTTEDVLHIVNEEWTVSGFSFCGIAHSHPINTIPSMPDIKTAVRIMQINKMTKFIMPILTRGCMDVYVVDLKTDSSYEVHQVAYKVVDVF